MVNIMFVVFVFPFISNIYVETIAFYISINHNKVVTVVVVAACLLFSLSFDVSSISTDWYTARYDTCIKHTLR